MYILIHPKGWINHERMAVHYLESGYFGLYIPSRVDDKERNGFKWVLALVAIGNQCRWQRRQHFPRPLYHQLPVAIARQC